MYATPEDAVNASHRGNRRLKCTHISYIRAEVGRWKYDGKLSETYGETSTFSYRDRQGRELTTMRFTRL